MFWIGLLGNSLMETSRVLLQKVAWTSLESFWLLLDEKTNSVFPFSILDSQEFGFCLSENFYQSKENLVF